MKAIETLRDTLKTTCATSGSQANEDFIREGFRALDELGKELSK